MCHFTSYHIISPSHLFTSHHITSLFQLHILSHHYLSFISITSSSLLRIISYHISTLHLLHIYHIIISTSHLSYHHLCFISHHNSTLHLSLLHNLSHHNLRFISYHIINTILISVTHLSHHCPCFTLYHFTSYHIISPSHLFTSSLHHVISHHYFSFTSITSFSQLLKEGNWPQYVKYAHAHCTYPILYILYTVRTMYFPCFPCLSSVEGSPSISVQTILLLVFTLLNSLSTNQHPLFVDAKMSFCRLLLDYSGFVSSIRDYSSRKPSLV